MGGVRGVAGAGAQEQPRRDTRGADYKKRDCRYFTYQDTVVSCIRLAHTGRQAAGSGERKTR